MLHSAVSSYGNLSKSQLRRRRSAAIKQKMYEASRETSTVDSMREELRSLTDMVSGLHQFLCYAVIQVPYFASDISSATCFNDEWHPTDEHGQNFYNGNPWQIQSHSTHEEFESEVMDQRIDLVLWQPGSKYFLPRGSGQHLELQEEAASLIQKFYRSRRTCISDSASVVTDTEVCRQCGELFSGHSDTADSCDRCAEPYHSYCLQVVAHPIEPYRICLTCIRSDDEILTEAVAMAEEDQPENLQEEEQQQQYDSSHDVATLDGRLDYMLKFLEQGGCPNTSGKAMKPEVKDAVLAILREALEWKKIERSGSEMKNKIVELDALMMKTVQDM